MKKLLTISIPTWNRASLLAELLDQLIHQVRTFKLEDRIQLLVSDNASDDNTWEIATTAASQNSFISLNRNKTNIGAKSNVLKSMELAESEFVMFLGDDDRIRKDCLSELLNILEKNSDCGIFIDLSRFKNKSSLATGSMETDKFLEQCYWYMGNAGYFVTKTAFIKDGLAKYGYDFFNECWPQTQLMILGLDGSGLKPFVQDLEIPVESRHDNVMIYSSYYLWKTCLLDLLNSINAIKQLIPEILFDACRNQMKFSVKQNFLNILQCGVYIDEKSVRKQTVRSIQKYIHLFSKSERIFLSIINSTLSLPTMISRPISDLFIYATRGKTGLGKKNTFVNRELEKKRSDNQYNSGVRTLIFENN